MKNVSMPKTKRATLLHIKHGAAPMRRARLTPTTTTTTTTHSRAHGHRA